MSTFTESYVELMNLKDKDGSKLCVIITTYPKRARSLADYFEKYSCYSVRRHSFAQTAQIIAPKGNIVSSSSYASCKNILTEGNPDYIIIEDNSDIPQDFDCYSELFELLDNIAKETPVIFISEYSAELFLNFKDAVLLRVTGCNEQPLKVKASKLSTPELYLRNNRRAVKSGIFYVNDDFFNNFIQPRMEGDALLEKGKYKEAIKSYYKAQAFHNTFAEKDSSLNDFLTLTLYLRILACHHFDTKKTGNTDFGDMLHIRIKELTDKLSTAPFGAYQATVYLDYVQQYRRFCNNSATRILFYLFLNEYAF